MRSPRLSALSGALLLSIVCAGCGGTGKSQDASQSESSGDVPKATSVVEDCAADAPNVKEAGEPVDTASFKKDDPWVLGLSAASLTSSSYIVYWYQELQYAVSQDDRFS